MIIKKNKKIEKEIVYDKNSVLVKALFIDGKLHYSQDGYIFRSAFGESVDIRKYFKGNPLKIFSCIEYFSPHKSIFSLTRRIIKKAFYLTFSEESMEIVTDITKDVAK